MLRNIFTTIDRTPQDSPIPGREGDMVQNEAGGYVFKSSWDKLFRRFLAFGAGPTYYSSGDEASSEQLRLIVGLISDRPGDVAAILKDERSKLPKVDQLLMTVAYGSITDGRQHFLEILPDVVWNLSNLYQWAAYRVELQHSASRSVRRAVEQALLRLDQGQGGLDYQVAKYRERNQVSFQDLLNLFHPRTKKLSQQGRHLCSVLIGGKDSFDRGLAPFNYWRQRAMEVEPGDVTALVKIIETGKLTREMVPGWGLATREVWQQFIRQQMPVTAMIRNLRNMIRLGVFADEGCLDTVVRTLREPPDTIHPFRVLLALRSLVTYQQDAAPGDVFLAGDAAAYLDGGVTQKEAETVGLQEVIDALEQGYTYLYDRNRGRSSYRAVVAVDVSPSMWSCWGHDGLLPGDVALTVAKVFSDFYPDSRIVVFSTDLVDVTEAFRRASLSRLKDAVPTNWGGTDCALPMIWAESRKVEADMFVVLTDNETWAGKIHPSQALRRYRNAVNGAAKLATVALEWSRGTIADPSDPGMLDIVGSGPDLLQQLDYFNSI